MVIVAHPDDAEFMCAGTLACWARGGAQVTYLLVTNGDKGSDDPAVRSEDLARIRHAEQREAARICGAQQVVFLDYEDGMVEPSLALRRDIARVIRQYRPHAVICQDPTRFFAGRGYINHPDHRAVAEATLAAIYPAARDRLTFPELLAAGFEPHKVKEVFLGHDEAADVIVDISETFETKIAALRAHRSQMADWDPAEMIGKWAAETAKEQPFAYGEAFRYLKMDGD
jgi:LmbE family N-acetylglucosaminyl deacetylase